MRKNKQYLLELLEPSLEAMGYELVHIEFATQDKQSILRVYIDAVGGIGLEDCETVSRQLSVVLDVEASLTGAYSLEVSSPGLDRPLVKPDHFMKFIGDRAKITTYGHILGRRRFTGQMVNANQQAVTVEIDGESYELPYSEIESARLQPMFD